MHGKESHEVKNIISSKEAPQKEDKISNFTQQFSDAFPSFSPDLKTEALNIIIPHLSSIDNPKIFLRQLSRLLKNKEESQILNTIKEIIKQKDLIQEDVIDIQNGESQIIACVQKNEKVEQEKEDTKQEKEEKEQQNETINEETLTIKEQVENHNKQIETWHKKVQSAYQLLDPKYTNHTSQEIEQKIHSLSPKTKAKLKDSGLNVEEYAGFLLSRDAIGEDRSNPANEEFLLTLKGLEKTLNLREENQFSTDYTLDKELLKKNPDMLSYTQENKDLKIFDNSLEWDWLKSPEDNFAFVQKFGTEELKNLQLEVRQFFTEQGTLKNLNGLETEKFKKYRQQLVDLKLTLGKQTDNLMKFSLTNAPIPALMNYLDQETIGNQTLSDIMTGADQNNAIKIKEETDPTTGKTEKIMHIQGNIDGKSVCFCYNLNNPDAQLQCDDVLHRDPLTGILSIGQERGERTNLNINMPSIKQLSDNLQSSLSPEKIQEILSSSSDSKDYFKKLNQEIHRTLKNSFADNSIVKSRISRHTEKNLAMEELEATLLPPEIKLKFNDPNMLTPKSPLYNFFHLLDERTEKSTSADLQSFRRSFKKLNTLLDFPKKIEAIQDPLLKKSLQDLYRSKINKSDFQTRSKTLTDFFSLFVEKDFSPPLLLQDNQQRLSASDLEAFLSFATRNETIQSSPYFRSFSPLFQQSYTDKLEQGNKEKNQNDLADLESAMDKSFDEMPAYSYA